MHAPARLLSRAAAAAVIAYAKAQLGTPYQWGGTGPGAYDCSGLAMQAYRAAGIVIPRTSRQQWAQGPRVTNPVPGDLVFFAGAAGSRASPGHVGIVIGPHRMIDAYGTGYGVETDTFGRRGDAAKGLAHPVGFTDPLARSRQVGRR
jgi:cell wall-associated NlpC family hydrolase